MTDSKISRRVLLQGAAAAGALSTVPAFAANEPVVAIETSLGTIEVRLDPQRAPLTVANFLNYANDGFYNGTIFHRVIDGFMIQGGGFTPDLNQKTTRAPVVNEARGTSSNQRGTIAMARTSDPHSATSQFFINTANNNFLDASSSRDGWGYAVFGRVIKGMDVVDRISQVKTGNAGGMSDVPVEAVKIIAVKVLSK